MPNSSGIIDSLFLELGIDTSRFGRDQQAALEKIRQFESAAKKGSKGAAEAIKTVGDALRDIARDSRIGASTANLELFSKRLKSLGQSAQVAGGVGTPFGAIASGIGSMLSPAALGVAAIGLLGKEMWDLNKAMTATNASIFRQSQLSGTNAENLFAWGEAARTVGANPQDITGGISALQEAISGSMVGAGNALPQLIAMARLGIRWNPKNGLDDPQIGQMFSRVHDLAAARGFRNLGSLRAITRPFMNDAMWALATSPNFKPTNIQSQIRALEPQNLGDTLRKSLESQEVLGQLGIRKDILGEIAYGGEQGLMAAVVRLLTSLLDVTNKIAGYVGKIFDFFGHPGAIPGKVRSAVETGLQAYQSAWDTSLDWVKEAYNYAAGNPSTRKSMAEAMKNLTANGLTQDAAAAIVGNMTQESGMDPLARNASGHVGLMQWDKTRQAAFAKEFGYQMGSSSVDASKQFVDELKFSVDELRTTHKDAAARMNRESTLMGKAFAFMHFGEIVNDHSFGRRLGYAMEALQISNLGNLLSVAATKASNSFANNNVRNETHIGDVHVHTPSTDPHAHARAVRDGLSGQPILNLPAQGTVTLATRGMVN